MGRRIIHVSLIQPTVICILERKNKFIKLKEIIMLRKRLKINIPQSVELSYPRIAAPFFSNHHFAHTFQQKAPSGLASV